MPILFPEIKTTLQEITFFLQQTWMLTLCFYLTAAFQRLALPSLPTAPAAPSKPSPRGNPIAAV